jgi:hypothetical protein
MSGRARPNPSRSARRASALGLLLLTAAPAGLAHAAAGSPTESPVGSHGTPTQDGWWNRLQGPAEGEPDGNPIRPLVPPVPKPPNVPADAIATSAGGGQVDKVAAVGVDVALADGAALDGLTLRLKESPAGGANVGADKAKVVACPVTVPWGPGQNAAWRERPTADCGLATIEGARAGDGTWTFDLTPVGRLWADPFAPLAADGVVLAVDATGSPAPVQVSWLNVDSGNVSIELRAAPVAAASGGDVGPAAAPVAVAPPAPGPSGPSVEEAAGARAFPASPSGISTDPLAYPSGQPTFAAVTPAATEPGPAPAETTLAAGPPRSVRTLGARPAVDFWERVPAPTTLLVPVAFGLAVLVGVVLGPTGRPSPIFRREGGLSRALARRARTVPDAGGPDAALRPPAATR